MEKDLILIIDMQNVYGHGGQWCCPGSEAAAGKVRELLDSPAGKSQDVIFTRFLASEAPVGVWKQYNRENAEVNEDPYANEMMACFAQNLQKYPLYTKSVYSSLEIPEVREAAGKTSTNGSHVVVAGVVAECCVLATVMALIDMGASVIYLTDGVAGISRETEEAVELVLSGLEPLHVRRMTVKEYIHQKEEKKQ